MNPGLWRSEKGTRPFGRVPETGARGGDAMVRCTKECSLVETWGSEDVCFCSLDLLVVVLGRPSGSTFPKDWAAI